MLRSLFSSVSGLRTHQVMMDVIGNNIANVNTTGYKSSSTVFEDTLSQSVRAAGAPAGQEGGTSPAQVGLGVRLAGIVTNFAQGATQMTGRQTDVAIQGDGFFVVRQGGQTMYSRAGAFTFDAVGNLVNPEGATVQGWPAVAGAINTNGPVRGLKLPIGQVMAPEATATLDVAGNLPADAATGTTIVNAIDIFDTQGEAIPTTITYTKTGANAWSVDVTVPDPSGTPVSVGSAAITWDPATATFSASSMTLTQAALNGAGYVFAGDVTVALGTADRALTQYAAASTVAAQGQDGAGLGELQTFTMDSTGVLTGVFSNGLKQSLGQVAMANFTNPGGLEKAGDSLYRETVNSGLAVVGTAGTGGRGLLAGGALEMSNVDLAQEFTNLVVAQRGFQANSRVVSASDEILQDLVNLKR